MVACDVNIERTEILLSVKINGEFGEIAMCGEVIDGTLIERAVAPAYYDESAYLKLPKDIRLQIRNKAITAFQKK